MTILRYKQFLPQIGSNTYIAPTAQVIGNVIIGQEASLWPMAVVRGDMQSIRIGNGTNIQDGAVCHVTQDDEFFPGGFSLTIGDFVTVGHKAVLHGCEVGDHSLIGIGAIVLDGAKIEPWVMVGAGSLVPPGKTLESGFLWVGTPVIKKRPLTQQEKNFIKANAQSYIALKKEYL